MVEMADDEMVKARPLQQVEKDDRIDASRHPDQGLLSEGELLGQVSEERLIHDRLQGAEGRPARSLSRSNPIRSKGEGPPAT